MTAVTSHVSAGPGMADTAIRRVLLPVTTLLFGKLGDMLGRKPVLLASIAVFIVGSAACAAAPTMAWLIAARALQGIGGGGLNSLVMTVVAELVPAREHARHQAVLGLVPAVAIVFGPLLGGLIVDHAHWGWIFLINLPLGAAAFWLIRARLVLPAVRSAQRPDFAGAGLAVVFTTSALLLLSRPWDQTSLPLAALAAASLAGYLWIEERAAEPITPLSLFADGIFSISAALFFLATAALFAGLLFVPLMVQAVFGLSAVGAGASIVPLLLGLIAASVGSGAAISKGAGCKPFTIAGAVLSGAGLAALGTLPLHMPLWQVIGALVVLGSGLGLFIQVAVLAGQNAVPHRHPGVATGTLNFFKTMGGATGAAVLGAVLAAGVAVAANPAETLAAFHHVFRGGAIAMVVALVLALLLREKPLSAEMVAVAEGLADVPEY